MWLQGEDPYEDFRRKDSEENTWLQNQPMCDECGERIMEDYYYNINGRKYCQECIDDCKEWID